MLQRYFHWPQLGVTGLVFSVNSVAIWGILYMAAVLHFSYGESMFLLVTLGFVSSIVCVCVGGGGGGEAENINFD